jgi:Phage terminase, small subunit
MRRVSDRLKRLAGTDRKDRRRTPPRPPANVPRARPGLPKLVRIERARLLAALATMPGLLTRADDMILELTAAALAEHHQAARVLIEQGASYECKTAAGAVMRRARPEQAIADAAWRRAVAGIRELGLTPAARTRIDVDPPLLPSQAERLHASTSSGAARFFKTPGALDVDTFLARRSAREGSTS